MKIGLYVHIPFCHSKCYYCDFLSFPKREKEEEYVNTLIAEIANYGKKFMGVHTVKSLFIGGGTPTVLSPFLLDRLCEALRTHFVFEADIEWTIEANPGTILEEHTEIFKKHGVNRVSLGLQAAQNHLLKDIGRIHTYEEWVQSIERLRRVGITNLNTDIMFSLPGQTLLEWQGTLKKMVEMNLPHLSAYSLIIEEGTAFGDRYEQGIMKETEEALDRNFYEYVKAYLKEEGYVQYELSNWSKPGFECEHNKVYWNCEPYLGLGLGAHSYMDQKRFHNTTDFLAYLETDGNIEEIVVETETISTKMAMEEFMFLGLRLCEGISIADFEQRFGCNLFEVYGKQIEKWMDQGMIVHNRDKIYLSEVGKDVSNQIFTTFLLDEGME
ncbi:MAG: radical SAM family heme chaperone HemW [Niameybacter sp.]|uniref:radical SAM family heme chaperone HemW n=1 Tax=Niameybacter sp. TaxID=2033640 RepID=UPI002FC749A1